MFHILNLIKSSKIRTAKTILNKFGKYLIGSLRSVRRNTGESFKEIKIKRALPVYRGF